MATYDRTRINLVQGDLKGQADLLAAIIDLMQNPGTTAGDASAANQASQIVLETAMAASLSVLDDWDESDRLKANIIAGQAGITAGAGAVAANTPRITLASDDPAVASLATIVTNTGTVAGAVSSSRMAVNVIAGQSGVAAGSGVNGVTVQRMTVATDDVVSTNLVTLGGIVTSSRAAVNIISGQAGVAANTGAASATTIRVVAASDSPEVTSLSTLAGTVTSSRVAVNLISGQAGVAAGSGASGTTTQRVIAATDSPEVTALGAVADAAVTNPASSASVIAALKGLLTRVGFTLTAASGVGSAALRTINSTDDPVIGATNETAPATDTATSGLNGRLQRIAQRLTTLIAFFANGVGASSTALRVVLADDGGPTSTSRITSAAASTNATSAKGSAGVLHSVKGYNAASIVRYLKFYNKATSPTVGTDTPVLTLALPPQTGFSLDWPQGRNFATGIGYALTTGNADADTGALTAGDVLGLNVEYR